MRIARLAFAGLGIAAIVSAITAGTGGLVNFFSYFTIESNLLAIVVLIAGGLAGPRTRAWGYLRGAVTLFMVITGIVYAALLANAEVGLVTPWIDDTLHRVIPLVMLADWIFFPPWGRGSYRAALGWLAGPLARADDNLPVGRPRMHTPPVTAFTASGRAAGVPAWTGHSSNSSTDCGAGGRVNAVDPALRISGHPGITLPAGNTPQDTRTRPARPG